MAKVTRHNHPLMVEARKLAYNAGLGDGFKRGYEQASKDANVICNKTAERLHKFYKTIISGLENKMHTMETVINGFDAKTKPLERVKGIRLIVCEDNDMPNCSPSSVAIKLMTEGEVHGLFYRVEKPTLTASEVVEVTNKVFEELTRRVELWLKAKNSIG